MAKLKITNNKYLIVGWVLVRISMQNQILKKQNYDIVNICM